MKNLTVSIALLLVTPFVGMLHAQDVVFTQFENAPLYVNSALTGHYNDAGRAYCNYRYHWSSALKSSTNSTGSLGFDSSVKLAKQSSVGIGFSSFINRTGDFGTNQFNLHASLIQNIGDVEKAHHKIAIGTKLGFSRLIAGNDGKNYLDISPGIAWSYISNTRFSFQLGTSIDHINRPNYSLSQAGPNKLYSRFNLHGKAEIPLLRKISAVPLFLFSKQGPHEQLIFGSDLQYLFKSENRYLPIQTLSLGLAGRVGLDYKNDRELNTLIFRTSLETKKMIIGFSYDAYISAYRYSSWGPSVEFSWAYRFNRGKITKP